MAAGSSRPAATPRARSSSSSSPAPCPCSSRATSAPGARSRSKDPRISRERSTSSFASSAGTSRRISPGCSATSSRIASPRGARLLRRGRVKPCSGSRRTSPNTGPRSSRSSRGQARWRGSAAKSTRLPATWRGSRSASSAWNTRARPESALSRLVKILWIALRFGLDEFALPQDGAAARTIRVALFFRSLAEPRAVRLRRALETLGPIFVKFGQVISTRRDLLPADLADELAKLQDQVPPFPGELAIAEVERAFGKPIAEVFERFDPKPVASASVAQVHLAVLAGGTEAAVKILRPGMLPVIGEDLALLDTAAGLVERFSADGRRLRPREVVAEFARH